MTAEWRRLRLALQLLTRLPAGSPPWSAAEAVAAMRWYGVIGAVVGALSGALWCGGAIVLPPGVAAGLALALAAWLTSALHEDGLADTADGLGGGRTADRALEIMRDSRIGAYGVVALVLAFGLRWQALATFEPLHGALALILAATTGRAAMVPATALARYARTEGAAAQISRGAGPVEVCAALVATGAVALILGPVGLFAACAGFIAAAAVLAVCVQRIGGYTGDCLGAIAVVAETVCLVVLSGA